jgi:hypothetical protein
MSELNIADYGTLRVAHAILCEAAEPLTSGQVRARFLSMNTPILGPRGEIKSQVSQLDAMRRVLASQEAHDLGIKHTMEAPPSYKRGRGQPEQHGWWYISTSGEESAWL